MPLLAASPGVGPDFFFHELDALAAETSPLGVSASQLRPTARRLSPRAGRCLCRGRRLRGRLRPLLCCRLRRWLTRCPTAFSTMCRLLFSTSMVGRWLTRCRLRLRPTPPFAPSSPAVLGLFLLRSFRRLPASTSASGCRARGGGAQAQQADCGPDRACRPVPHGHSRAAQPDTQAWVGA